MIVPVGNQQYFVRLAGAGEPVVLLHGFTGTAQTMGKSCESIRHFLSVDWN